mgnify:CR=1 FL=1
MNGIVKEQVRESNKCKQGHILHKKALSENETLLEAEHYRPKGKVARYEMSSKIHKS